MSTNQKQFLISVGDAELYSPEGDLVLTSKTEINSTLKADVQNKDIFGGFGAGLQYSYSYQKVVTASMEDARWDEQYLAINSGKTLLNGAANLSDEETVTLSGGTGTLVGTPVGNIFVERANGAIQTITPTGSAFTVSGGGSETVTVHYFTSKTADRIQIDAESFPGTFKLVIKAKLFQSEKGQTQTSQLQIVIPQFKPTGSWEIALNMDNPATSKLEGKALAFKDDNGKQTYANVYIVPLVTSAQAQIVQLAATPSIITGLDHVGSKTAQIQVIGIRGNGLGNVTSGITGLTYTSSDVTKATVSNSGLVTAVAAGTITITVSNGTLSDIVSVTVI